MTSTIMMVLVMVYAMICYNIALETGGMKNFVFKAALGEFPIMIVAGFILDTFIAGPLAKKCAFKIVTPGKDRPIAIILAISVFSIWFMCPMDELYRYHPFQWWFQLADICNIIWLFKNFSEWPAPDGFSCCRTPP